MATVTGYDFKEYFSATPLATFTAAGARTAAAGATYACEVQDVTIGRERSVIEWRNKCGVGQESGAVKKTISVTMTVNPSSTAWGILKDAFDGNDTIFFASLTPDAAGDGIACNCKVASLGQNQPLEGAVTTTVTLVIPDLAEFVEVE
jgi:hypothetical protein